MAALMTNEEFEFFWALYAQTRVRVSLPVLQRHMHRHTHRQKRSARRCHMCKGCAMKQDCGKCKNCIDKKKFGGAGLRKRACVEMRCAAPSSWSP